MTSLLAPSNPAFVVYCRSLLLFSAKCVSLAALTARARISSNIVAMPEDGSSYAGKGLFGALLLTRPAQGKRADKVVVRGSAAAAGTEAQRVHALHQHTLENGLPWALVGLALVASGASEDEAQKYCYGWLALRVLHSFIFLGVRKQPWRGISWTLQLLVIGAGAGLAFSRL